MSFVGRASLGPAEALPLAHSKGPGVRVGIKEWNEKGEWRERREENGGRKGKCKRKERLHTHRSYYKLLVVDFEICMRCVAC